jgi:hypothetical protein
MAYGIEGRIDVAEPKSEGEAPGLNVARRADRSQQVEEKERQPTGDEGSHDQSKDESRSFLPLTADPPSLTGRVFLSNNHSPSVDHLSVALFKKIQEREMSVTFKLFFFFYALFIKVNGTIIRKKRNMFDVA